MNLKLSAPVVIALSVATISQPQAAESWQIRPGAVVCPSYSAVQDGGAAAERNDQKWLAETGCVVAGSAFPVTLLPPLSGGTFRVRLHLPNSEGATVYTADYNVLGFAEDGKGPMPWHSVNHHNWEIVNSKSKKPSPKSDPEAFADLMKNLSDKPKSSDPPPAFDSLLPRLTSEQRPQGKPRP